MTTIAYCDGVVAYDAREVWDGTILSDESEKHREVSGVHFFMSGNSAGEDSFIEWWFDREDRGGWEVDAIVWDGVKLWLCGRSGKKYWATERGKDKPLAIGAGAPHAFTAMDMGADAKTSVQMAMKRNYYTGGKIRTFKIA